MEPVRPAAAPAARVAMSGGPAVRLAARLWLALGLGVSAAVSGCAGPGGSPASFEPDSVPEAYRHSTAALLWPGAARSFQITPAGDLYNGEWKTRLRVGAGDAPADSPRVIAYEGRWMPVAHWTRRSGEVWWRFSAAALPAPPPRDSGLVATLRVEAVNRGSRARSVWLEAALAPPDSHPAYAAFDALDGAPPLRWAGGRDADTAAGWVDGPARPAGAEWRVEAALGPGESRAWRVVIPSHRTPGRALAAWARTPHARRLAEVRAAWNELLARGTKFELGDPEVEDALRGALVVLLGCRERRGDAWVPIGNPFQYRDVWLRDGARAIAALSVAGFTREARDLAAGFLDLRWPHGAFLTQRGQPDGAGQALWAFEQACLRPEPDASVRRFAESARATWRWLEWERDLGARTGWSYGMLRPFAYPRDNEMVLGQLVGSDAWALAGYRSAARLLRAAGLAAAADSVEASRRRYALDFERALSRSGSGDIPSSWQGPGLDWGNLAVAWPCGALPAEHPRCRALARRLWAGGPGLVPYGTQVHTYLGADLGVWALMAGERESAEAVLADALRWRSASGGAAELVSPETRDYGRNLPPHATSAAALVLLVRHALVFDDADTLMLALGARDAWWRGTRVRGAPTRWGTIDLEFARRADAAEWRWTPVDAWTLLALPPGAALAADPPPPLRAGRDRRAILAPPGTGHAVADLRPAGAS